MEYQRYFNSHIDKYHKGNDNKVDEISPVTVGILKYLSMTLTYMLWRHIEFLIVFMEGWQRECLSKVSDTVY